MKNILITGGSGFISHHFHKVLDPKSVFNIDLVEPNFEYQSTYIKGDIRILEDMKKAIRLSKCDTILSLAAEHKDFGLQKSDYFKTNEYGTKIICEAASCFDVKNIIFYSSVAVYGNNTEPSYESMPPKPVNFYGASKLAGEQVLVEWANENEDRKVLIIRPTVVYGERNVANMYRLIEQINKGRYFHIGEGRNVKSIAYVQNLVDATLFLMKRLKNGVDIYNYADEPHLSSRKIASTIAKALGKNKLMTLPYKLVYTLGLPFDIVIKLTGKDLPISTNRVKKFCTETFHKSTKIREAGFLPRFDNVEGLTNMVEWMKEDVFEKI